MQQTVGDEEARQALDFLREETKGISPDFVIASPKNPHQRV